MTPWKGVIPPKGAPRFPGSPETLTPPTQVYKSPARIWASPKRICVLVRGNLNSVLKDDLDKWARDMEREGWGVERYEAVFGTPEGVRLFLESLWARDCIVGCVLVGNVPAPWFEMDDDFFMTHREFPCDLFYMDLDGAWTDKDKDRIYDGHGPGKGDERPDLFTARLDFTKYSRWGVPYMHLKNYLKKVHSFRVGELTFSGKALSFQDDLWAHMDTGLGKAFARVVTIKDPAVTTAPAFLEELKKRYDSVVVCAASDFQSLTFQSPSGPTKVDTNGVLKVKAAGGVFNFFGPFTCRYIGDNFLGGAFLLSNKGWLVTVGSAKMGSMLFFGDYYGALGKGLSEGESFRSWFAGRYPYSRERVRWFYGMILLGDPTLPLKPAALESPLPNLPAKGGKVEIHVSFSTKEAGKPYVILASLSGGDPGTPLPGARIPLKIDKVTGAFLSILGSSFCPGWAGKLDSSGAAKASLVYSRSLPFGLAGTRLFLSALVLDPAKGMVLEATPALRVSLGGEKALTWDKANGFALDKEGSGLLLASGTLLPGKIGGSGVLGDFDPLMFQGVSHSGGILKIDTDKITVKSEYTLTGKPITVTNGVFEFGSFHVPPGLTLRFKGSSVPKILVRREARIDGKIEVNGLPAPVHNGMSSYPGKGGGSNCGGAGGGGGGSSPVGSMKSVTLEWHTGQGGGGGAAPSCSGAGETSSRDPRAFWRRRAEIPPILRSPCGPCPAEAVPGGTSSSRREESSPRAERSGLPAERVGPTMSRSSTEAGSCPLEARAVMDTFGWKRILSPA